MTAGTSAATVAVSRTADARPLVPRGEVVLGTLLALQDTDPGPRTRVQANDAARNALTAESYRIVYVWMSPWVKFSS